MTETTRAKRTPSRRNGARAPQQGIGRGTAPPAGDMPRAQAPSRLTFGGARYVALRPSTPASALGRPCRGAHHERTSRSASQTPARTKQERRWPLRVASLAWSRMPQVTSGRRGRVGPPSACATSQAEIATPGAFPWLALQHATTDARSAGGGTTGAPPQAAIPEPLLA